MIGTSLLPANERANVRAAAAPSLPQPDGFANESPTIVLKRTSNPLDRLRTVGAFAWLTVGAGGVLSRSWAATLPFAPVRGVLPVRLWGLLFALVGGAHLAVAVAHRFWYWEFPLTAGVGVAVLAAWLLAAVPPVVLAAVAATLFVVLAATQAAEVVVLLRRR